MSHEALLAVELEVTLAVIDDYFVVHGLACKVLHVWMHARSWHSMHVRLADVLGNDWNTKLPYVHFFVISCGHKPTTVLNEGDRIDRAEMLFILLHDLFRVRIVL